MLRANICDTLYATPEDSDRGWLKRHADHRSQLHRTGRGEKRGVFSQGRTDGLERRRSSMSDTIRVLIVGREALFRKGLKSILDTDSSIEVVGMAASAEEG